jgi:molybdate transport system ATP-binding protein
MSLVVDIRKQFKGFTLEISFESGEETLGILGASGCGKSVTLKCIAGLIKPDEGIIRVGNRTVFDSVAKIDIPPQQRHVGYLFQNYALFPHMTIAQNIRIACKKKHELNLTKLMEQYEIQGLEDRYPSQLSGGQQQRVAIARIFASGPEVLLLDEPFSALDSYLRENMQAEIIQILRAYEGSAVFVTHNRDEVYRICPELVVMDNGSALEKGLTHEIFDHPRSKVAARLTGCKNLARIEKISDTCIRIPDWRCRLETNTFPKETYQYIGIRARNFQHSLPENANPDDYYTFPIQVVERSEGVFEQYISFQIRQEHALKDNETEKNVANILWWICDKRIDSKDIEMLYLKKDALLMLT